MRATRDESTESRQQVIVCCALIAVDVLLNVPVLLQWARGTPPLYPGQYQSRLLSALTLVGIMGAMLVMLSHHYHTARGRFVCWLLLGVAVLALASQVIVY